MGGAITGSTTQSGTFNFTITATDVNSGTTARAFTMTTSASKFNGVSFVSSSSFITTAIDHVVGAGMTTDGKLVYGEFGNGKIYYVNPDTGAVLSTLTLSGTTNYAVTIDDSNNIWCLNDYTQIRKYDSSGTFITSFNPGFNSGCISYRNGRLILSSSVVTYIVDPSNGSVITNFTSSPGWGYSDVTLDGDDSAIIALSPGAGTGTQLMVWVKGTNGSYSLLRTVSAMSIRYPSWGGIVFSNDSNYLYHVTFAGADAVKTAWKIYKYSVIRA